MLQIIKDGRAEIYKKGFFFKKYFYRLYTSKTKYYTFDTTPDEWNEMLELSDVEPVCYGEVDNRSYWLYEGKWWWEDEHLGIDDVHALLYQRKENRSRQIDRAKKLLVRDDKL